MNVAASTAARMKAVRGIHPNVVAILKDKSVRPSVMKVLRGIQPERQMAMVKVMVSMGNYTKVFAHALLVGVPVNRLVKGNTKKDRMRIPSEMTVRIENEVKALEHDLKTQDRYGCNMLELTVIQAYVRRLLRNANITLFLKSRYPELFLEIEAAASPEGL